MVQHFQKSACQRGHGNPEILIKLTSEFDEANQNASGGAIKNCFNFLDAKQQFCWWPVCESVGSDILHMEKGNCQN